MLDLTLLEKLPLEVLNEGVISSLGDLYSREVVKEVKRLMKDATCSSPFRSDPIGGSELDPGCYDTTISLYQNHLSKTNGSVTFQLA